MKRLQTSYRRCSAYVSEIQNHISVAERSMLLKLFCCFNDVLHKTVAELVACVACTLGR